MSAFTVSKLHIDALVNALSAARLSPFDLNATGQILWDENYRSVNARYPAGSQEPAPRYSFTLTGTLPPVSLLKQIDCYEYQSCEHEGWEDSQARKLMRELYAYTVHRLPGWDEAPWGL